MSPASYIIRDYRPAISTGCSNAKARPERGPNGLCDLTFRFDRERESTGLRFRECYCGRESRRNRWLCKRDPGSPTRAGRSPVAGALRPPHRGIAGKLVDNAISHTLSLGIKTVHVNIWQSSPTAKKLLRIRGFRCIRRYLELRLDLSKTPLTAMEKSRIRYRFLKPGEEEGLTHLQNRSFAGAWGYNPNTVDEMILRTRLPGFSRRDIIIAFESDKKPIGYCWTRDISFRRQGPQPTEGENPHVGRGPGLPGERNRTPASGSRHFCTGAQGPSNHRVDGGSKRMRQRAPFTGR